LFYFEPSLFRGTRSAPARIRVVKILGLLKKQATIADELFFKSCALTFAPFCNNNSIHSGVSTIPKNYFEKKTKHKVMFFHKTYQH
jgi:predicted metal-binding protein